MILKDNVFNLSIVDTNVLKGIAIIAMLCHHSFDGLPENIEKFPFFLTCLAVVGKVCVSLFLFCSGYGLTVQYRKIYEKYDVISEKVSISIKFLFKRLTKFYSSYWFVFIIFVPLGILLFDRTLEDAYGLNMNVYKRLFYDFLGLQGYLSYNATWWFNKLIIIFYIIFPIIFYISKKIGLGGIVLSIFIMLISNKLNKLNYYELLIWQLPFVLGVYYALYQSQLQKLTKYVVKYNILLSGFTLVLFVFFVCQRIFGFIPFDNLKGIRIDAFIALTIIFAYILIKINLDVSNNIVFKKLSNLGLHSNNIYLIHTFFYLYFVVTHELLYNTFLRTAGINMLILLVLCYFISFILEFIKDKVYWNKLTIKIIEKIDKYNINLKKL